ncbi:MAG: TolC family protein [Flavobacteriales bacterium]|nr:TolC family protein [Flavobacteriales bacterium]
MLRTALTIASLPLLLATHAQDTLKLGLNEADQLLSSRSLALIAQRYEIDQAEADRVQAKLFYNPTISTEWSMRPSTGSFFDVAQPNGQKAVSIEQLFRIGGQRSLAVKAAAQRTKLSEAEYAELAAALKLQLHSALYREYYLDRAIAAITSQLTVLKNIVDGYGVQLEKGNVSLREVTRLRTSYFALNGQRADLQREQNAIQADLSILLSEQRPIDFTPTAADLAAIRPLPLDTAQLISTAENQRPRVQAAAANAMASELDLKYQRRMALPDLALGATYDQNSNYLPNYTGLNAGISIPLFDRNQGRIARARAGNEQARAELALEQLTVRREVLRAYQDLRSLQDQYTNTTQGFGEQLDQLSGSLIDNYVKSNISLIEFTDLFESYNASIIALNKLKADLQNAYEELEFVSAQRLFQR